MFDNLVHAYLHVVPAIRAVFAPKKVFFEEIQTTPLHSQTRNDKSDADGCPEISEARWRFKIKHPAQDPVLFTQVRELPPNLPPQRDVGKVGTSPLIYMEPWPLGMYFKVGKSYQGS